MGSIAKGIGNGLGDVVGGLTGGLSNTDKYQSGTAPITTQDALLAQIAAGQGGYNENMQNQGQLAQQLQAQMRGEGPSLAQSQLSNATNQNIQQASGMAASQKGISPALAARMAAQSATYSGQQAANQSAGIKAQEQMGAQQQLGGLYGQMGQQNLGYQNMLQGALAHQNATVANSYANQQGINAGVAGQNAKQQFNTNQGFMNSLGGAGAAFAGASEGGEVGGQAKVEGDSRQNDTVPTMLSPGEIVIPRTKSKDPDKAKEFIDNLMSKDGKENYSEEPSYHKVLKSHKELQEKVAKLEKMLGKKNG